MSASFAETYHSTAILCAIEFLHITCVKAGGTLICARCYRNGLLDLDGSTSSVVATTSLSFFWRVLECHNWYFTSQVLVICVKLAHNALGLVPPTLEQLNKLHERLVRSMIQEQAMSAESTALSCSIERFSETLLKLEIEVLEKLEFYLAGHNNLFQYVNLHKTDKIYESTSMHHIIFLLSLTENFWLHSPKNLAHVSHSLYSLAFQKADVTSTPSEQLQIQTMNVLNDLFIALEVVAITKF